MKLTLATSAALGLADVVTTAVGRSAGIVEGNLLIRHELAVHGIGLWALMKTADWLALVAFAILAYVIAPSALRPARFIVQLANVVMAFVVLSNVGLIVRG